MIYIKPHFSVSRQDDRPHPLRTPKPASNPSQQNLNPTSQSTPSHSFHSRTIVHLPTHQASDTLKAAVAICQYHPIVSYHISNITSKSILVDSELIDPALPTIS